MDNPPKTRRETKKTKKEKKEGLTGKYNAKHVRRIENGFSPKK